MFLWSIYIFCDICILFSCFTPVLLVCIYTDVIPLYWNKCILILVLYCYFTSKRHLTLVFKGLPGLTPQPGSGLAESSCADAEELRSEIEKLKQQLTSCSSFIPTGNLTMSWGKSVYSHCQLPFSWTELIKVLSFIRYYPILSPFF